jgi:hypothetical protein
MIPEYESTSTRGDGNNQMRMVCIGMTELAPSAVIGF